MTNDSSQTYEVVPPAELAATARPVDDPPAKSLIATASQPATVDAARAARLVRALWLSAIALGVFTASWYVVWGAGAPLLALPWFNAFALTFQALTSMAVAYVAFGRYRVLNDATSYWVAVAFSVYGTALVMYMLVWPGLLPGGGSFLARYPSTPAWFTVLATFGLWTFLQIAAVADRSAASRVPVRHWWRAAVAAVALSLVAGSLTIAFESRLPVLVSDGGVGALLYVIYAVQMVMFAAGTWFAARQSERRRDPMLALTAFLQLTLGFTLVWVAIGGFPYSIWWYLGRIAITAGALVVLFGMLGEHVSLLRRERQKTRDLTAHSVRLKAAEAELLENYARLQQANLALKHEDRRKNEFLATLSHELRNPLATISSVLEVWDRAGHTPGHELASLRRGAIRQAGHMARLLDDLLDVARITGGRINLRFESVALADVVRAALDAVTPALTAKEHEVDLALEPGVRVRGDSLRLTQAVTNLLDNAAKYTPAGGRIEVAVAGQAGDALVRVRDNGIGIPPQQLDDIFGMFVRADGAAGRDSSGLGIGLTLTRTLMELHDGAVEVASPGPGRGSEFVLRLPLAPESSHAAEPAVAPPCAAPERSGAGRRVLLVEDNRDAAEAMAALLVALGHEVATADSGEAAVTMAAALDADVVLLDIGLPGIDGYETARRLRATSGFCAVLVALTGYGRQEDRARVRAAGFDCHLVKPVNVGALTEVLADDW